MGRHELDNVKQAIIRVLDEAGEPFPAPGFLDKVVGAGHDVDDVISAIRQMFDNDQIRFDSDMKLRLARQLA